MFHASEVTELSLRLDLAVLPWVFWISLVLTVLLFLIGGWWGEGWWIGGTITACVVVVVAIWWPIAAIPYDNKYWSNWSVAGTVESVSNGVAQGDDLTYRVYVVKMEGDDRPYVTEDARITALQGQDIELRCLIDWEYEAADQWNCKIRSADYTD